MELRKRAFGLSLGLLVGLSLLLLTWWLLIVGSHGASVSKIGRFIIGYNYSWTGALIGFLWGFLYGFIGGVLIASFYNFFSKIIYK